MAVGQILAGARITAALLQSIAPMAAVKTADEPITSSTTLQNDNELFLAVAAGGTYLIVCYLNYEGGTQGSSDMKFSWTVPSGATLRYFHAGINTAGVASIGGSTSANVPVAGSSGAGNLQAVLVVGTLVVAGTAGNLQLQWAQNNSSGTATIMHAQSALAAWQLS